MEDKIKIFLEWFDSVDERMLDMEPEEIARVAFFEGWKAAQQSAQRTAFLAGLGVGIFIMTIIAIVVINLYGCR